MKNGNLVAINPVFFGYDNIPAKWHNSVFLILKMEADKKLAYREKQYMICDVLTPEGTVYNFYDYELDVIR